MGNLRYEVQMVGGMGGGVRRDIMAEENAAGGRGEKVKVVGQKRKD